MTGGTGELVNREAAPCAPARAPLLWQERLAPGEHWSGILRRGTSLQLVALEAGASVAALLYNHESPLERYNMADTLKAQHTAFLTQGCVCYSDMGRVLCSVTADSCGWHDTLCGLSDATLVERQYGRSRFQEQRNDFYRNGRDSMLIELGKYGLGKRDLVANINFFSRVTVNADGSLQYHERHARAGDYVELRFEMHTLLVLATCPHPLDPAPHYRARPVELRAWRSGPAPAHDACRERCSENARGLRNTEMIFAA
jgi:urea carboxylase-associated protein 2